MRRADSNIKLKKEAKMNSENESLDMIYVKKLIENHNNSNRTAKENYKYIIKNYFTSKNQKLLLKKELGILK